MKKVLILFLVLIFAGAVLSRNVFAASETVDVSVSYKLPYPGFLPNSPLYLFKNVRDQVVGFLVMGPVNRSFYFLFLSDKRLWAGEMLVLGNDDSLGVTTLYKSEEYFSLAVDEAVSAKKQNKNISELSLKLLASSTKHEEILNSVLPKVKGNDLTILTKAITLSQKSRSRVVELSN